MMCKNLIFMGLVIIGILVACNNVETISVSTVDVQLLEEMYATNLDTVPFIVDSFDRGSLLMFDLLTNEIVTEFNAPQDVQLTNVQQIGTNYYGVFGLIGFDGGMTLYGEGSINVDMIFFLLDKQLNLVEEFEITDSRLIINYFRSSIWYEDGKLSFFYSFWNNIYTYCANTHETSILIEMYEEYSPHTLELVGGYQLAFIANRIDDEISTHYGLIDLETKEVQMFFEQNFRSVGLNVYGNYIVINENIAFSDDFRSQIIVINASTSESSLIQLEGYESQNARLVHDGHFILTRHTEWLITGSYHRIRLYNLGTMEVVLEHEMEFKEDIIIADFLAVDEGVYAFMIGTGNQFKIESLEFDTIFIVLEEVKGLRE